VEIFYAAAASSHDRCFVCEDTELPMMDMSDSVWPTLDLMDPSEDHLCDPAGRNVEGRSFLADTSAEEVRRYLPGLSCAFIPDEGHVTADSWPLCLDDRAVRSDWDGRPEFGPEQTVEGRMACV